MDGVIINSICGFAYLALLWWGLWIAISETDNEFKNNNKNETK